MLKSRPSTPARAVRTRELLAAGFVDALGLPDYDSINASFFATPFDWAGIRARGANPLLGGGRRP